MTARNFVPRVNEEGQLGTEKKKWSKVYSDTIYVNNVIGNLIGTADMATNDSLGNNISNTYATKNNPSFSGTPISITPGNETNNDQIATTAFVHNLIKKYLSENSSSLEKVYPVGSIYMSIVSTNPSELFGFGTWEAMPAGRVLLAQGIASWGTYNAGSMGGEASHILSVGEMPIHNHSAWTDAQGNHAHTYLYSLGGNVNAAALFGSINKGSYQSTSTNGNHGHSVGIGNAGSSQAHNNMQPYIAVYMWKRTA